jgi:phosphoglycerate dehydrogenase-like enzyme
VAAAPLTVETRGLIGEREFAAMKATAVVMNLGRGPVIDESRYGARAFRERRIRGAALDVFETEPLPEGHPLYGLDNVLLSPHTADHTADWLDRAMQFFLENFARFHGKASRCRIWWTRNWVISWARYRHVRSG